MAKKYHPDARPSQEEQAVIDYEPNVEKFREITEAYSILSSKDSR